jgi:hypothetical protein
MPKKISQSVSVASPIFLPNSKTIAQQQADRDEAHRKVQELSTEDYYRQVMHDKPGFETTYNHLVEIVKPTEEAVDYYAKLSIQLDAHPDAFKLGITAREREWCETNCKGAYFISTEIFRSPRKHYASFVFWSEKVSYNFLASFEDARDATLFKLFCQ